jgi:AcrR family transcriptional regulator
MPIIVDKEAMRMEILMAFQRCIEKKPMTNISLRDIAAEAGMSHAKLLNYFDSRDDLMVSYVRYTKNYMTDKCKAWFSEHDRLNYESNLAYMNAFMSYVANGKAGEQRPNATTQTYVLTHYNPEIAQLVKDEFKEWRETMEECLVAIYGETVGRQEAEAMMILISGTFICNYNGVLTGGINHNIIGYISNLAKS